VQIGDSILNSDTRNYTSQLEAQYETNKKENEILRLQQVQTEKDFQLKRRNTWLGIGIGLIAALIIILYLLKRNYGNKQKLAQQQAVLLQEKIRTIEKEQQITSLQSNDQWTGNRTDANSQRSARWPGWPFPTVKMHYSTLQKDTPSIKGKSIVHKNTGSIMPLMN
jgi:Rps23 Pro-64 3,4-dihydroxylase Tpa1-like proline 4-hydroxylase